MGTGRLELLEQRIVELEKAVDEMKAELSWWKWWRDNWGKWMQQVVPELTSMKRNLAMVFATDFATDFSTDFGRGRGPGAL